MRYISNLIIVVWGVFWIYWFISAIGSKRNVGSNIRPFIGARIGLTVLAVILFRFLNVQNYSPNNSNLIFDNKIIVGVGFVLFLCGLLLAVWARLYLGKNWGMPMTQKQDPELVTTGPYHLIRHPIYSGILLAVIASAFAGSFYWFSFLVIMGPYFIYSAVFEEKLMQKQFPKVYPEYKSKTKMLIPFIF